MPQNKDTKKNKEQKGRAKPIATPAQPVSQPMQTSMDQRDAQNKPDQKQTKGDPPMDQIPSPNHVLVWMQTWLPLIVSILLLVVIIVQAWIYNEQRKLMNQQTAEMAKSVQSARDQLTLAYPPRVIVTSISFWEKGDREENTPPLKPGMTIELAAYAVNAGREATTIRRSECFVGWYLDNILPLKKPFATADPGSNPLRFPKTGEHRILGEIAEKLEPGKIGLWLLFEIAVPSDYDPDHMRLYVLGQVLHEDRLGTRRGVFYCRGYDSTKQMFIPVQNPDYENSDEQE